MRTIYLTLLLAAGCGSSTGPVSMINQNAWKLVAPAEDPFSYAEPVNWNCESTSWGVEIGAEGEELEVSTEGCNYFSVRQFASSPVASGETAEIKIWHFALSASDASIAVVSIRIGDNQWDKRIPIPSDSELISDTLKLAEPVLVGEEIWFHVHNHGQNSYNLIAIEHQ